MSIKIKRLFLNSVINGLLDSLDSYHSQSIKASSPKQMSQVIDSSERGEKDGIVGAVSDAVQI